MIESFVLAKRSEKKKSSAHHLYQMSKESREIRELAVRATYDPVSCLTTRLDTAKFQYCSSNPKKIEETEIQFHLEAVASLLSFSSLSLQYFSPYLTESELGLSFCALLAACTHNHDVHYSDSERGRPITLTYFS